MVRDARQLAGKYNLPVTVRVEERVYGEGRGKGCVNRDIKVGKTITEIWKMKNEAGNISRMKRRKRNR